MQELPDRIYEWTAVDRKTGLCILVENTPEEILKEAVEWEKAFFKLTARRRLSNINITAH